MGSLAKFVLSHCVDQVSTAAITLSFGQALVKVTNSAIDFSKMKTLANVVRDCWRTVSSIHDLKDYLE